MKDEELRENLRALGEHVMIYINTADIKQDDFVAAVKNLDQLFGVANRRLGLVLRELI